MSTEANKAMALRASEEVWSKGNLDVVEELFDVNYVHHEPFAGETRGREGLKHLVTMWRTAYPDLKFTTEDLIAEGDKVVQRWSCVGTHQGELMGIPATGKRVTTTGISIIRFERGKAVEERVSWDALGGLQQLGVVPPLGKG